MVPPESPATSTAQAIIARQPILLSSPNPHAACVLLTTNPREPRLCVVCTRQREATPTIPVSMLHDLHPALGKRARFPFSPLV